MKKAIFLFVCILTISSGFSQKRERIDQANKMTQEQRTTLAVKKLTLALDLDKSQVEKVATLFTKMDHKRMQKRKERRDANFEAKNKHLDHMITLQNRMKKILTKEQYETYKKMEKHRVKKHKKGETCKKTH